ncbi:hypothetical protein B0H11DRAFT_1982356 [Mycena galericulata]|nr:hypothetical protein B0H11DRAFT_1982356 [Mycena galericulata]
MLFCTLFLALTALQVADSAPINPMNKRIQQTIDQSTAKWEQACLAAGGGFKCNPLSVTAFSTLLAAAGSCDQQNAADSMIQWRLELKCCEARAALQAPVKPR